VITFDKIHTEETMIFNQYIVPEATLFGFYASIGLLAILVLIRGATIRKLKRSLKVLGGAIDPSYKQDLVESINRILTFEKGLVTGPLTELKSKSNQIRNHYYNLRSKVYNQYSAEEKRVSSHYTSISMQASRNRDMATYSQATSARHSEVSAIISNKNSELRAIENQKNQDLNELNQSNQPLIKKLNLLKKYKKSFNNILKILSNNNYSIDFEAFTND
jgi:hypothetical protein